MSFLDEVIKRVRDDDAARPRSVQAETGWSEVGGCRAYLGFRLDGAWPSEEPDNWAAIRGTALHAHLEEVLAGPGVLTEVTTSYRGIPGHADLVRPGAAECWDFKTTRLANSQTWRSSARALRQKRIQVHGYAAGLVEAGTLPEDCTVGLLVIPVDGSFADWWAYEEPFDRSLADEGADRLAWVRERMAAGETAAEGPAVRLVRVLVRVLLAVPRRRRPEGGGRDHRPGGRRCRGPLRGAERADQAAGEGEGEPRPARPRPARHRRGLARVNQRGGRAEDGP